MPWHRVVNKKGTISLKTIAGYTKQKILLMQEGVDSIIKTSSISRNIAGNQMKIYQKNRSL
ncbi:hypothetical protein ACFLRW_03885 [Acidobacteriota bacterium]